MGLAFSQRNNISVSTTRRATHSERRENANVFSSVLVLGHVILSGRRHSSPPPRNPFLAASVSDTAPSLSST